MRWFLIFIVTTFSLGFAQDKPARHSRTSPFSTGERLEYRMYMGVFTVGKGVTTVDNSFHVKNEHSCYKVDAFMKTSGMATWISKVDDNWGAYIDTTELLTHESYRRLSEGRYRLHEVITYDHNKDEALVLTADKQTGKFGKPKRYSTPDKVRDIVAGFMYLRVIDFSKYKVKDTLTVSGFFEDKAYQLKIIYSGRKLLTLMWEEFRATSWCPSCPITSSSVVKIPSLHGFCR